MNKKVEKNVLKKEVVYDGQEDLEIRKVANQKNISQKILLSVLIVLFCSVLIASIFFISTYYINKKNENKLSEKIEVTNNKNKALIINNGEIEERITTSSFINDDEIIIEKINSIELVTNKEKKEKGIITFDVIYSIIKNDFERNALASNKSDILVRFSYSYDNKKWIYLNNVISTSDSTLNPLMGKCYDISGINSNLKIATNYELSSEPGKSTIMYWRSETIIKEKENIDNNIVAEFKIEYKDND